QAQGGAVELAEEGHGLFLESALEVPVFPLGLGRAGGLAVCRRFAGAGRLGLAVAGRGGRLRCCLARDLEPPCVRPYPTAPPLCGLPSALHLNPAVVPDPL